MERIKEIERSIIKTYRPKIWAKFVKAIKDYELLKKDDHICVCISGGKDSMLMAKLFQELKRHSDFEFEVTYIVMNPGYSDFTLNLIKDNIKTLEIPAEIVNTDIFEIANKMDEDSPCYLCARMRRGALYKIALNHGCNKIALGHHYDDMIETFMMSILNNGSVQTMLPKLHSENYEGLELIRPMYLIRENDVKNWASKNDLKFIQCACKFTERVSHDASASKRKTTKQLLKKFEEENPVIIKNIFRAASNVRLDMLLGYKKGGENFSFLDEYDKK